MVQTEEAPVPAPPHAQGGLQLGSGCVAGRACGHPHVDVHGTTARWSGAQDEASRADSGVIRAQLEWTLREGGLREKGEHMRPGPSEKPPRFGLRCHEPSTPVTGRGPITSVPNVHMDRSRLLL